ncbi:DUF3307 domain-containing protein [Stackebrandtia soli]|uniref:DUF3307 domain-containing protein n=1 Tax=Stackebrandtia soli TaxID=1892856 RepID=UPI0039EB8F08
MAGEFAAVAVTLFIAHMVADHWAQTHVEATNKAKPGWCGRAWCALHVSIHTVISGAAVAVVAWRLGLDLEPVWFAAGLVLSGATHFLADRRWFIEWLAGVTGSRDFYQVRTGGICGPYLLDQSWHIGWMLPVSLLIIA